MKNGTTEVRAQRTTIPVVSREADDRRVASIARVGALLALKEAKRKAKVAPFPTFAALTASVDRIRAILAGAIARGERGLTPSQLRKSRREGEIMLMKAEQTTITGSLAELERTSAEMARHLRVARETIESGLNQQPERARLIRNGVEVTQADIEAGKKAATTRKGAR